MNPPVDYNIKFEIINYLEIHMANMSQGRILETCTPYTKTLYQKYRRLADFFSEGNERQVFFYKTDYGNSEGVFIYSYGYQSEYGDQTQPKPSILDIVGTIKWNAWEGIKGMSRADAQQNFINYVTDFIKSKGRDDLLIDPEKAVIENKYKKCVDRALTEGKSLKELEEERQAFI